MGKKQDDGQKILRDYKGDQYCKIEFSIKGWCESCGKQLEKKFSFSDLISDYGEDYRGVLVCECGEENHISVQ